VICERHDAFVHASPVSFGRNVFVCVECLNPHKPRGHRGALLGQLLDAKPMPN
jgi:hypothetical protein